MTNFMGYSVCTVVSLKLQIISIFASNVAIEVKIIFLSESIVMRTNREETENQREKHI